MSNRKRLVLFLVLLFGLSGVAAFAQGRGGIPRVIGWASTSGNAGITWGAVADITPTQAGITYDAASLIINVPTGKTVHFKTNGVGGVTLDNDILIDGATADEVQLTVQAAAVQSAAAVLVVENSAGTDQFWVTYLGGATLTSSLSFTDNNVTLAETGTNDLQIRTDNAASLVISGGATTVLAFQGTTFTIADAAGNAGPVFTDAGTTIDTALDGALTVTGATTLNAATVVDGVADVVQLTVQGVGGQVVALIIAENSVGTDQFTVSASGAVTAAGAFTGTALTATGTVTANLYQLTDTNVQISETGTNVLTLLGAGGVLVDGTADVVQMTLQGNATQTTAILTVENSAGTDQFTVSNAGAVVLLGDITGSDTTFTISDVDGSAVLELDDTNGSTLRYGAVDTGTALRLDAGEAAIRVGTGDIITQRINAAIASQAMAAGANPTTLAGQLALAHLSGGGGLTTGAVAGTGCGTSSLPTQAGGDISGTLGATCGTAGTTTNPIVTVTFADAYGAAPFCTIAAMNAATAAVMVSAQIVPVTTTTTLAVNCGGGTCPTGTLLFSYSCSQ